MKKFQPIFYNSKTGRLIQFLFVLLLSGGLVAGCAEESENFFEEEVITQNAGIGPINAYEALEVVYLAEVQLLNSKSNVVNDGCTLFTNDPTNRVLTLDFGTTCLPYFLSKVRTGKIIVQYPTVIGDTLTGRTLTFEKYTVSSTTLEGEITYSNVSRGLVDSKIQGTVEFNDFKVGFPDGSSATFNGPQLRIWTAGEANKIAADNTYQVTSETGSFSGDSGNGHTFVQNITTPVLLNYSCAVDGRFAAKTGVMEITNISGYADQTRVVNFGNDVCDKLVSISTDRRSYIVSVN